MEKCTTCKYRKNCQFLFLSKNSNGEVSEVSECSAFVPDVKWINVKDRLPKIGERVFTANKNTKWKDVCWFCFDEVDNVCYWENADGAENKLKFDDYWMPIPEIEDEIV